MQNKFQCAPSIRGRNKRSRMEMKNLDARTFACLYAYLSMCFTESHIHSVEAIFQIQLSVAYRYSSFLFSHSCEKRRSLDCLFKSKKCNNNFFIIS